MSEADDASRYITNADEIVVLPGYSILEYIDQLRSYLEQAKVQVRLSVADLWLERAKKVIPENDAREVYRRVLRHFGIDRIKA